MTTHRAGPRVDRRCRTTGRPAARRARTPRAGPVHTAQRAGVRQRSQASDAAYPRRGVCTSTGPALEPGATARRATCLGIRAARASGSRSSSRSVAPATETVTAARSASRGRGELVRPAGGQQLLGLDAAGEAADQSRGALDLGPRQQHLAGMGVRRARLGVEVVAVVPDRHQPEVVHRREGRRTGADHDPPGAAGDGEELAVAAGRARAGGEHDVVPGPEHLGEGGVDAGHVAVVGDAEHAPAPAGERAPRPPRRAGAASPPRAAPTRRRAASHRPPRWARNAPAAG